MKQSIALTELMRCLDEFAPFALASDWDNSGLQIGDFSVPITGILLCVDCTEAVVQEAVEKRCELILSHHPAAVSSIQADRGAVWQPARRAPADPP